MSLARALMSQAGVFLLDEPLSALDPTLSLHTLEVLSQTAHGVAAERQAGSLDLLMATPLRARAVVGGKFDAAVVGLAPLYAIPLLAGLVGTVVSDFDGRSLLAWFCTSSMLAVFVIAVGLCASVRSATAGGATIRAFTLLVGGMLLHAIVIVILALALSGKMRIAEVDLWLWLGAASPVALVAGSTWAVTDIQGQGGEGFFIVTSGEAEAIRERTDGAKVVVNTFGATDFFGELALLDDGLRTASVITTQPTSCLVLTRWDFLAALRESNVEMSVTILEELAKRFRRALDAL